MTSVSATASDRPAAAEQERPKSIDAVYTKLEKQRIEAIKTFWKTTALCLALVPVVVLPMAGMITIMVEHPANSGLAALAKTGRQLVEPYAMHIFLGAAVWLFVGLFSLLRVFVRRARQPGWDYIRDFKAAVFNHLCDMHFPGLAYDPKGYVGYDEFDATRLFAYTSDGYLSEDYFSGRIGKTDVSFAEVTAKRERRRLEDGSIKTYLDEFFHGLVFIADFHKHFHSTTRLVPRAEKLATVRGQETVVMEDPEFEETFATVSTDQVDVRYILSTSMVSRILKLNRRFPGMRALFRDEKLILALPTFGDKFEPSLYSRARSPAQLDTFVRDIQQLLHIVEELNLNTRIWSKT